jgi:hypothetical protein
MAHTIAGMFQVPDDGDDYDAASVNVPFEWLAYRRSRQVASIAELKAIAEADRANGDVVTVVSGGVSLGAYTFSTTFASTPLVSGFTETPDVGAGTWVSDLYTTHGLDDQLSGFAAIDNVTERLARPEVVPYRTVFAGVFGASNDPPSLDTAVGSTVISANFVDALRIGTTIKVDLPDVEAGDLIRVSATLRGKAESGTGDRVGYIALGIHGGGNEYIIPGAVTVLPAVAVAIKPQQVALTGIYEVAANMASVSARLKLRASASGTGELFIYDGVSLTAEVIRP